MKKIQINYKENQFNIFSKNIKFEECSQLEKFSKLWDILKKYDVVQNFEWNDVYMYVCDYPEEGMTREDIVSVFKLGFIVDTNYNENGCIIMENPQPWLTR